MSSRPDPASVLATSASGLPLVSIVVATRNEAGSIRACLAALQAQSYPVDRLEIIVSDGMSTDGTRDAVAGAAADDPRIRLVDNTRRITPTAWNTGIRAARGEVIGIMSGHAVSAPDYIERCVDALRRTGAMAVGGRIRRVGDGVDQRAAALVTSSPFGVGNAAHNYATTEGAAETVFPGMWPRGALQLVGLFDEELVRNQDDELSFRIREAGGVIWYDPAIVVSYEPRRSAIALFRQYRDYGMWKVRVFQKHPKAMRPRQLVPAAFVGVVVIGLGAAVVVPVMAIGALGAVAAYGAVTVYATLRMPARDVPAWRVLRAFGAVHVGYGIGIWMGVVRFLPRWFGRPPRPIAAAPLGGGPDPE